MIIGAARQAKCLAASFDVVGDLLAHARISEA